MHLDPFILSRIQFAFVISFHIIFPGVHVGIGGVAGDDRGRAPGHRQCALPAGLRFLAEDLCAFVRHGSGDRRRDGISVRHQLERAGGEDRVRSRGRCWATRHSPPSCWSPRSSASCSSGATACRRASTSSPAAWYPSARCSRRSGSSPITAGCRFRSDHTWSTARSFPADWWAITTGPVMLVRWPHMLFAAFLTTGMCVAATGAWYILRAIHRAEARVMLNWGLGIGRGHHSRAIVFRPSDGRVRAQVPADKIRRDRSALENRTARIRNLDRHSGSAARAQLVRDFGAEASAA